MGPDQVVSAQSFADGVAVRNAAGEAIPKLTNLQYARLTPVDTNWVKLDDNATFTLTFAKPATVGALSFHNLRYTISSIYPPEEVEVLGATTKGGPLVRLAKLSQPDVAARQGRNRVATRLSFDPTEVVAIRIEARAYATIPAAHHKAGSAARLYFDELVVE